MNVLSIDLPAGVGELVAGVGALLAFGVLFALAKRRFVTREGGEPGERTRVPGLD